MISQSPITHVIINSLFMNFTFITFSFLSIFTAYINTAPQNIALAITVLFSVFVLTREPKKCQAFYKDNRLFFFSLIMFFVIYNSASLFHFGFSQELAYSIKRTRWALFASAFIPAFVISISNIINRDEPKRVYKYHKTFFYLFSALFTLIFLDSCLKLFFHTGFISELISSDSFKNRASWTFNPIPFSKLSFFGVFIMLFYYQLFKSKLEKTMAALQVVLMISVTVLTQTRASWLGALVALTFFCCLQIMRKKSKIVPFALACFLCIIVALLTSPTLKKRLSSTFTTQSFSNSYRIEHWKANLRLIVTHPMLGVGNNQNRKPEIMSSFLNEEPLRKYTNNEKRIFNHPHNEFLDIAAGSGVLSLIFFLLCLFYPVFLMLRNSLADTSKSLPLLSLSYLAFYYFSILFDKITYTNWVIIVACWACAFIPDHLAAKPK